MSICERDCEDTATAAEACIRMWKSSTSYIRVDGPRIAARLSVDNQCEASAEKCNLSVSRTVQ